MQTHTFHGSLAELQALVATLGVPCHWEHKGPFEMAVFDDPSSNLKLNWWPSTGVIDLVGDLRRSGWGWSSGWRRPWRVLMRDSWGPACAEEVSR